MLTVNPASTLIHHPPGQLEKMKVEARKNAKANFTWSKSSAEAIQFYKDVLQYFEKHQWECWSALDQDPCSRPCGRKLTKLWETWGWPCRLARDILDCFCHAPEKRGQQLLLLEALEAVGQLLNNFMYSNLELAFACVLGKLIVLPIVEPSERPEAKLAVVSSWDNQKGSRFGLHRFAGPASIACMYRTKKKPSKGSAKSQLARIAFGILNPVGMPDQMLGRISIMSPWSLHCLLCSQQKHHRNGSTARGKSIHPHYPVISSARPLTCELCKSIYPTYIHTNSAREAQPKSIVLKDF